MNIQEENEKQWRTMAQNLKQLRKEKKWSIEELSQKSEINCEILRDIESGRFFDFDLDFLFKLCKLYGVKVHKIFLPLDMK